MVVRGSCGKIVSYLIPAPPSTWCSPQGIICCFSAVFSWCYSDLPNFSKTVEVRRSEITVLIPWRLILDILMMICIMNKIYGTGILM